MDPFARFVEVDAAFEEALALTPDDRTGHLASLRTRDPWLAARVEALLNAADNGNAFMPAGGAFAGAFGDALSDALVSGDLASGTVLGPYTIVDVAGVGAMGEVYRARDARLNRDVAIKALPREFARDIRRLSRLKREARVLGSLNHPCIAGIHDVFEGDFGSYLVLEFVEGEDLARRVRGGALSLTEVFRIGQEIAAALHAAHTKAIVHRDLKPANIRLTPHGHVKLLDFGIASSVSDQRDVPAAADNEGPTRTLVAGTPAYMSPEQAAGCSLDPRMDIWAFGCVLYELLTGRRAFVAMTDSSTPHEALQAEPDWTSLPADAPPELIRLIRECLRRNPAERVGSAAELQATLAKIADMHTDQDLHKHQRRLSWFGRSASIAGGVLLLWAVGGVALFPARETNQLSVRQMRQLTFASELELDPALSPDGARVAYAVRGAARTEIHVRPVTGGKAINLTRSVPGMEHRWPRWSRDGEQIAFVSRGDTSAPYWTDGHALHVMSSSGGVARHIVRSGILGHTWAPDGEKLAFAHDNGIYVSPIYGAPPTRIAEASGPHSLSWSPDGKWIAFVSNNHELLFSPTQFGNVAPSSIMIVPARGGDPRPLTDDVSANFSPSWMPDSRSLLFVSNRDGSRDLFQLHLSDSGEAVGRPVRLTTGLNALSIDASKDGRQLLYSLFTTSGNLWAMPIPNTLTTLADARPLTTGSQVIEGVGASPDGEWIAFDSNLAGNQDIYRMLSSGGGAERLTTDLADDFAPSWSPNGKSIAFHTFRHGSRDIYVMSADGTNQERVTSDPAHERYANWSPDGRSLVFFSDKSGRQEIYVIARSNSGWGEARQLTFNGDSYQARWSPDGRTIAYISVAGGLFTITPNGEGQQRLLASSPTFRPQFIVWSRDSQTIYFRAYNQHYLGDLWSIPAAGGTPERLVSFDSPSRFEFATDGRQFFFTKSERQSDIWVLNLDR